ncbi:hypothetical protein DL93DRAFT_1926813 [Clavulina sp. PMI_390]|nr:hypothetical protein DL93DRAFT_1926813 [Clavulina sp. PMI_390]
MTLVNAPVAPAKKTLTPPSLLKRMRVPTPKATRLSSTNGAYPSRPKRMIAGGAALQTTNLPQEMMVGLHLSLLIQLTLRSGVYLMILPLLFLRLRTHIGAETVGEVGNEVAVGVIVEVGVEVEAGVIVEEIMLVKETTLAPVAAEEDVVVEVGEVAGVVVVEGRRHLTSRSRRLGRRTGKLLLKPSGEIVGRGFRSLPCLSNEVLCIQIYCALVFLCNMLGRCCFDSSHYLILSETNKLAIHLLGLASDLSIYALLM